MDTNLIYEKTAAGEEAMRQRTRLVQRHLRMVLILVDGRTSVGDLGEKVGNEQLVETALGELEKDGFIVPVLEQPSVWDKGTAVVQKVKEVALGQLSAFGGNSRQEEVQVAPAPPEAAVPVASTAETVPQATAANADKPPTVAWLAGWSAQAETTGEDSKALRPKKVAAGEETGIRPIRRGGRAPLGPLGKTLWGVCGALGLAVTALLLYPYDNYRPEVEAVLTRMLQQPVKAARLHATFLPHPGLVLEGVHVGQGEGIAIASVRFLPQLGHWRTLKQVEVRGVSLPLPVLANVPEWIQGARTASVAFPTIELGEITLQLGGQSLGPLAGALVPEGAAMPLRLSLHDEARTLSLDLIQAPGGMQLSLEGQGWEPVKDSHLRFDSLNAQGLLTRDGLRLSSIDSRTLEGQVSGSLSLNWNGGVRLETDLALKHLSLARLNQLLLGGAKGEGQVDASLHLSGRSADWSRPLTLAQGEGSFVVNRGLLPVDLAEAVRRASSEPLRGGETRFEQLGGKIRLDLQGKRFFDLQLSAGLLRATGAATVAADGSLGGSLDVQVGGKGNVLRMPLTLGGTLAAPVLRGGRR
jgi:hypothetical protein